MPFGHVTLKSSCTLSSPDIIPKILKDIVNKIGFNFVNMTFNLRGHSLAKKIAKELTFDGKVLLLRHTI